MPIKVTELGIITEVNCSQLLNKLFPIRDTELPSVNSFKVFFP